MFRGTFLFVLHTHCCLGINTGGIISEVVILNNWKLNNDIHLKRTKNLRAAKQLNNCLAVVNRFLIFRSGCYGTLMKLQLLHCKPALQ